MAFLGVSIEVKLNLEKLNTTCLKTEHIQEPPQLTTAQTVDELDLNNFKYMIKLINTINTMREEAKFIDTVLVCSDGAELPCHRVILIASNCPFFVQLLMNSPAPMGTFPTRITLPGNLRGYCIAHIMYFIYTGHVEMPSDTSQIKELLASSRFLKLDDFNKQMAAVLVRSLTVDNYTFVWDLADEYDVPLLRNEVITFVTKDLPVFLCRPEFLSFDVNRLKLLLGSPQANNHPHNKILLGVIAWLKKDFAAREKEIGQLMRYIKFCMLSKPFLKSVINTEPLIQESHTLWCFIAATLYSRGVHLQNYDPERDNITKPNDKQQQPEGTNNGEGGDNGPLLFTPPLMIEPSLCKGDVKPKKVFKEMPPKLPPKKSPTINMYTKPKSATKYGATSPTIAPIFSASSITTNQALIVPTLAKKGMYTKKQQLPIKRT